MYPNKTELTQHFSIFHLSLPHQVEYAGFNVFYPRLKQHGWQVHEYLQTQAANQRQRHFLPHHILTSHAHESLFGKTWGDDISVKTGIDTQQALIKERLNPKSAHFPHLENLLLSQIKSTDAGIGCQLALTAGQTVFMFTIEWVDLWLFHDQSAILAFKTKLLEIQRDKQSQRPGIDDLNQFNHLMRYPGSRLGEAKNDRIFSIANPSQSFHLWQDLVCRDWLGFETHNVLMLEPDQIPPLDQDSRYSKLLTVAQVTNIESGDAEFHWNRPVTTPDFAATADYAQFNQEEWTNAHEFYQRAMLSGAVNVRDLLLLELATTSREGKTWGGERQWQFDLTYVNRLFAENSIKIWSYWQGLALRDVCAFISYDDTMPLIQKNQAESWYYPLYVYTYHQHIRLNHFSQEMIDYELGDYVKARQILERFHAFHNQYWFSEVTIDFQGIEIAEKMRLGLGIENQYQIVNDEIKEISTFIERKMQAGKQALIAFLIFAFYPLQYFGIGEMFQTWIGKDWRIIGISTLVFLAFALLSWWILPRRLGFLFRLLTRFYHRHLG